MKSHPFVAVLAGTMFVSSPPPVGAQGARVIVTVTQTLNRTTSPAAGAAVCFTSTSNTKLADANGVVTFDNVPAGVWSAAAWKSGFQPKRADIRVSGTSDARGQIMLLERSLNASPCVLPQSDPPPTPPPARLGEEVLAARGTFNVQPDLRKQLDCNTFGTSSVMVGIKGKGGWGIDELRVGCATVQAGGTLSTNVEWTSRFDQLDATGTAFERKCSPGQVVSGISGTLENAQIRSITLRCKPLATSGLTTGSMTPLAPAVRAAASAFGPDACTSGRPARALSVAVDIFRTDIPLSALFAPWVIVGARLVCEQPVVP